VIESNSGQEAALPTRGVEVGVSHQGLGGALERVARHRQPEDAEDGGTGVSHSGLLLDRRQMVALGLFVLAALAFLYVVLPQLGGVRDTWDRLNEGNAWWIGVAVALELLSMGSYIALFQGVHVPPGSPIRFRDSYKITMASLAATRLFGAGGAGGVVLTAWSLRRSGMRRREVATRMSGFLVLLYGVYVGAMIICGVALYTGALPGAHPFAMTIVPAIIGAIAFGLFVVAALVPESAWAKLQARIPEPSPEELERGGRRTAMRVWLRRAAAGPASFSEGIRFALRKARHPDLAIFGAVTWWALNIAILYACFRAFGDAPTAAVVTQIYFVGMLANLLPVPGGIGAVEGGMVGASVALGVNGSLALIAVLTYRLIAFWLPSIPGGIAYFQLRRTVGRWQDAEEPPGSPALYYTK